MQSPSTPVRRTSRSQARPVLDQILTAYSISHTFEIYEGNHVNRIADRVETKTLPFFSSSLSFGTGERRK